MKKVIKKLASLLMVTVFVITGTTFQMLAGALSESVINGKQKLYISYYPYSYNFSGSGLGTSIYGQFVKINVGSANGEYAYCMDAEADSGITGTSIFTAEDFNLSDWVKRNYTSNQIKLMKYAAIYTIKNASETKYGYSNEVENIASQIINWTILHNWFNTSSESSVLNVYTANMPSSVASNVKACYNKIKEQILSHKTIPSFAVGKGQTPTPKKMTTNADGTFSITLTDNKNCSSYFDWAKALNNSKYKNYLSITTNSAGKLVIKSTKPIPKSDEFELTAKKTKSKYQNELDTASPVALIVDESQLSGQNAVGYTNTDNDPVTASISLYTDTIGTAQIKKVWQHNNDTSSTKADNSDIYFTIKNSSGTAVKATGSAGSYTYSASGSVSQFKLNSSNTFLVKSLPTGTYTVTEHGSTDYTISGGASKTVTVPVGGTGVVTFTNARNTGSLRVQKSFSDADNLTTAQLQSLYKSLKFAVKNSDGKYVTAKATSSDGVYTFSGSSATPQYYTVNSNGAFRIDEVPTGSYAITETACDNKYTPAHVTVTAKVTSNATVTTNYPNNRNTGSLRVQKSFSDADNLTTAQLQSLYKSLKFSVKNSDGKYVTAKATSSDGVYTFSGSSTTPQYYTVNSNGAFRIDKVPTGSYVITETAWDNKYTPAHVTVTAKVTSNATVTSDYPNNRNTGTGRVTKTLDNASALTADEKKDIYASIRFTVKTADGKYVTASATASSGVYTYTGTSNTALEYKINSNGVFRIDKMPTGTYALTETSCDDNYTPSVATKKFTVRANETTQVSYENTRDKGNGRIYKKWVSADTLTKDQIITLGNNVYFTVKTADGKYVTAKATSSDGVYNYTGTASTVQKYKLNTSTIAFRIDNMPTGTYTVTEYCSADGFNGYTAGTSSAPTTQTKTITVVKGATKSVKFTNKSVPIVVIRKHFSDEDNLTDEELKAQYAKVTVNLQVLGIAGKVQSTPPAGYYVNFTGSNGNYTFKDVTATKSSASDLKLDDNGEITISFGTNTTPYYMSVIENYSGTDYETDNRDQRIDLGDGNPNTVIELDDIEINNQLKSGSVQIDKEFLNENGAIENITDEQLAEVTFKIAHNGKYLTFTGADGAYTYNGENNAGTALKLNKSTYNFIASKLPAKEEYTVMEVSGTMGYSFSIDPVTFTITPAGTVKKVFTNRAMTGTISIVKHSADGVLSGWQFRVTGTAKTGQSYDKTFTTDANGTITISNIRIGDYKVTEVKTDKTFGYITEDSKDIEVKTDTVKTVNFTNKPYANIVINKVDSVTNAALSGVTFGIFTDADCENPARAYTSATDDTLIDAVITESATGKYTCNFLPIESNDGTTYYVKEISAPEHYARIINGFTSKAGKAFSAALVVKDGKIDFDFPAKSQKRNK